MDKFIDKYKQNKKNNILVPFNNEVIILQITSYNLISQISNNYNVILYNNLSNWIINSVDTKLIFLLKILLINDLKNAYLFNKLKKVK